MRIFQQDKMFLLFALIAHYRVRKYKPKIIHDDTLETETNSYGFKNKGTARFLRKTPAYQDPQSKSQIVGYYDAGATARYIYNAWRRFRLIHR